MELTHIRSHKLSLPQIRIWLRTFVIRTVSQQAATFEALTHGGTPFGGNWLPGHDTLSSRTPARTRQSVLSLQQQLSELTQQVARLNEQVDTLRLAAPAPDSTSPAPAGPETSDARKIGINRFRALQAS